MRTAKKRLQLPRFRLSTEGSVQKRVWNCRDFCRDTPSKLVTILHNFAFSGTLAPPRNCLVPSNLSHSVASLESSPPELLTEGL